MRMSELNLPTVEFKTNLTTYNMSLFSNFAIIFSLKDFLSENLFYIHTKIKIGMHVHVLPLIYRYMYLLNQTDIWKLEFKLRRAMPIKQAPTLRDMCNKPLILPLNNHFCEINFLKTNMRNFLIVTG